MEIPIEKQVKSAEKQGELFVIIFQFEPTRFFLFAAVGAE